VMTRPISGIIEIIGKRRSPNLLCTSPHCYSVLLLSPALLYLEFPASTSFPVLGKKFYI